jgi:hypothetical protein
VRRRSPVFRTGGPFGSYVHALGTRWWVPRQAPRISRRELELEDAGGRAPPPPPAPSQKGGREGKQSASPCVTNTPASPGPSGMLPLYTAFALYSLLQPGRAARRCLRVCRCSASGLPEVRGRACAKAASASYASCRSGSICSLHAKSRAATEIRTISYCSSRKGSPLEVSS